LNGTDFISFPAATISPLALCGAGWQNLRPIGKIGLLPDAKRILVAACCFVWQPILAAAGFFALCRMHYAEAQTVSAGICETHSRCDVIRTAVRPLPLRTTNPVTRSSIGYTSPYRTGQSAISSMCAPTGSGLRQRNETPCTLKSEVSPVPVYGGSPLWEIW